MTKKDQKVFIVTYPDGKIATGGVSTISEAHALAGVMRDWLSPDFFDGIEWGNLWGGGALYYMWPAMKKNGWKVQSIDLPDDLPETKPTTSHIDGEA